MTSKGNKPPPPPPPPPSVPPHTTTLKLKVKPGQDAPRNGTDGLPPMKSPVLRDNLDAYTDGLPPIRSSVSKVNLDDPKDGWGQKPYLKQTKPGFVKRMRKFFLGKNKKKKKIPLEVELR